MQSETSTLSTSSLNVVANLDSRRAAHIGSSLATWSATQFCARRADIYRLGKRAIDITGSSALIIGLGPVMLAVACAIKCTSSGPILFRQSRLTEGGRVFTLIKFRSMVDGAENGSGATFAHKKDPRVTSIGLFLRTTRLDELPQLFNVLRGDMSLIGPRPERPEIAEQLSRNIRRFPKRLRTKAGLTGLAQVIQGYPDGIHGYRRKLGLDLLYIKEQSLLMDLWIAAKTIGVVISGSGAR
jgi:lipopolysaccharide/colanic/teichoic acid biosynthesis glycosyltransferase